MVKLNGLGVEAVNPLMVRVVLCPTKAVVGTNAHVVAAPAVQEKVTSPPKLAGPATETVNVAVVLPMGTVVVVPVEVREKTASPVPESTTFWGLPLALSLMLRLPVRAPVAVGWNTTFAVQLWPTFRIFSVAPQVLVWAKSPVVVMLVMSSVEVPVLVICTACAVLTAPTLTFPKVRLVGASVTAVDAATPFPVTLMI